MECAEVRQGNLKKFLKNVMKDMKLNGIKIEIKELNICLRNTHFFHAGHYLI